MAGAGVRTHEVGSIPFAVLRFDSSVDEVIRRATSGEPTAVHFANAYTIALADTDLEYADLFNEPTALNFTDGVPVAWVGRRAYGLSAQDWPRVYGPDVMQAVFDRGPAVKHFLLGGSPRTLEALGAAVSSRWPEAVVVGAESPPFRPLTGQEQQEQDQRILDSGADLVWVGLGTPKQDWEVARLAESVGVVALAVGAAFDFLAGTKPQAPPWVQRSGIEWAYRLASEPRRLARRYLWGNPRFLVAAARNPGLRGS
jgi:N-acetylglucosaminyldiphosphoundecaprenol N-acetyl-beta-D-mannosaminyltransferase